MGMVAAIHSGFALALLPRGCIVLRAAVPPTPAPFEDRGLERQVPQSKNQVDLSPQVASSDLIRIYAISLT